MELKEIICEAIKTDDYFEAMSLCFGNWPDGFRMWPR